MMKDLGVQPFLYPMPTYMIGTYNEDDSVDVMMMAWGGICAMDMVALNLEEDHKTVANLEKRRAFTLAVPGTEDFEDTCNQVLDYYTTTFKAWECDDNPGLRVRCSRMGMECLLVSFYFETED